MRIIITEEQKKKLFVPRNIDEREIELKSKIEGILKSEDFQDDLKNHIYDWWPEISDFNEWLDDNGWDKDYMGESQYRRLGNEIADDIQLYTLTDFQYELMDFDRYVDKSKLVIDKLIEMDYL